jgi:pimeloyl-ACP methyl ester carboxylesterase
MKQLSAEGLEKTAKGFVEQRKKLMPDPASFTRFVAEMAKVWNAPVYMEESVFKTIQCPTLIAAGDQDGTSIERYAAMHRMLKHSQLAIVPGSDHLVLFRKPKLMAEIILPFVDVNYSVR